MSNVEQNEQPAPCPTIIQQLTSKATQPFPAFLLGIAVGVGGPTAGASFGPLVKAIFG